MNFNKNINGFQNELEISKNLNNKYVRELNILYREFLEDLFEILHNDDLVKCNVDYSMKKYDIIVSINDEKKYISLKKGIKNSVHVESITSFIHFLIDNKIDRKNIIEYLKYHYADGTTNGSGFNRISSNEYKKQHQDVIDAINKSLNKIDIVIKAINRFVLKGNVSDKEIDAILFGVDNDFIWILKKDIINIILSKIGIYSSGVHFGPLFIQPLDRCLNFNSKYDRRRFCIQVKWYNLVDDIIESMNNKVIIESGYIEKPQSF